jgi:hypothetical protein
MIAILLAAECINKEEQEGGGWGRTEKMSRDSASSRVKYVIRPSFLLSSPPLFLLSASTPGKDEIPGKGFKILRDHHG